ncbi:hypothetical protein SRHO_G00329700 [Serrasalmus rhombeus]
MDISLSYCHLRRWFRRAGLRQCQRTPPGLHALRFHGRLLRLHNFCLRDRPPLPPYNARHTRPARQVCACACTGEAR